MDGIPKSASLGVSVSVHPQRKLTIAGFIVLLTILILQLALSIRQQSQTWDEACHIFAGYSYWTRSDFAVNPEHPPLLKLLATAPLLNLSLRMPPHPKVFSKEEDFLTGARFLYSNGADKILLRARMASAILSLVLAFLLFAAVREMFSTGPAFVALVLLVFEPNILAHGALVTTDMGLTCFLFATVYAFYRYVKRPAAAKLALTGLAAGLALATKHSGILVFPVLLVLTLAEIVRGPEIDPSAKAADGRGKQALRLAASLVVVGVIAGVVLWTSYRFHFHPRPGVEAQSRLKGYAALLKHPTQAKMIVAFARWHLLPEPYLYGLADVGVTADFSHSYLLGTIYPHGKWSYFPFAFVIKTTLALLLLLLFVPVAIAVTDVGSWREFLFLAIPAAIYFGVVMTSGMNIGVRHILPIYPFLMILAGWAAWKLIEHRRRWAYVVAFALVFDVVSSVRAFPVYLAYSNELWGGPANTYKYLTDSNADWGQQLKATKKYLDSHHVEHCWFAYFAAVVADPAYYGIPCKPLTTIASLWLQPSIDVPASIDGPVLISAGTLSGYEFGPGELNPYGQFQKIRPTAVLEHGIFVYDGHFEIPLASALNHVTQAQLLAQSNQLDQALREAQAAVALAPDSVQTQAELGDVLMRLKRPDEAHQAFRRALHAAQTVHPEFQTGWVPGLRSALER